MRTVILTPSERRKAEQFDALLEGRAAADDRDLAPLLALSAQLRDLDLPAAVPDPQFRQRLRTRLLAVASVHGVGDQSRYRAASERRPVRHRARPRFSRRATLVVAGALAGLTTLTGVSAASSDANPGDPLYNVKRSREAAQLALARSDVSRGQLHLEFAQRRLREASAVVEQPDDLRRVLDDMDTDTRTGMRELGTAALERKQTAPLDIVDAFVASQRRDLLVLLQRSPSGPSAQRLKESVGTLGDVGNRAAGLRGTLLCTGSLAGLSITDELGPVPRICSALGGVRSDPSVDPNPSASGSPSGSPSGSASPSPSVGPSGSEGAEGLLGEVTGVVEDVVGILDRLRSQPPRS